MKTATILLNSNTVAEVKEAIRAAVIVGSSAHRDAEFIRQSVEFGFVHARPNFGAVDKEGDSVFMDRPMPIRKVGRVWVELSDSDRLRTGEQPFRIRATDLALIQYDGAKGCDYHRVGYNTGL